MTTDFIDIEKPVGGSIRARKFPVYVISLAEGRYWTVSKVRPAERGAKVRIYRPYERKIIVVDTYKTNSGRTYYRVLGNFTGLSDEEAVREAIKICGELQEYVEGIQEVI